MSSKKRSNDRNLEQEDDEDKLKNVCCILIGVVFVGIFITLAVYLGIFAYNNPDPPKCWVVKDLHQC